jgi:hypothetical protein
MGVIFYLAFLLMKRASKTCTSYVVLLPNGAAHGTYIWLEVAKLQYEQMANVIPILRLGNLLCCTTCLMLHVKISKL